MIEGEIDPQGKDCECLRNPVWIIPPSWDPSVLTIFFFFQNLVSFIFQSRVERNGIEYDYLLLNRTSEASVLKNIHKIFIFKVMKRERLSLLSTQDSHGPKSN